MNRRQNGKVFLEDGDNYVAASPANIYGSDGSESIQFKQV